MTREAKAVFSSTLQSKHKKTLLGEHRHRPNEAVRGILHVPQSLPMKMELTLQDLAR
jgi:hypothetical protein